jgi:hypothetical protein
VVFYGDVKILAQGSQPGTRRQGLFAEEALKTRKEGQAGPQGSQGTAIKVE